LGGFARLERSIARITMAFFPVTLRWVAFAFVALFLLFGLALAIAGIAILTRVQVVGGLAAIVAGSALAIYGVKLGVNAHSGDFPEWLRDIRNSAPL
jgi:amino acid transporter